MTGSAKTEGVIFDLDGTLYALPGLRLRLTWRLRRELRLLRRFTAARRALRGREFGDAAGLRQALGWSWAAWPGSSPGRPRPGTRSASCPSSWGC